MKNALLITIIGGGMVFLGLILLWVMMSLLVKLTTQKNPPPASPENKVEIDNLEIARKKKAAVAAVSAAMTLLNSTVGASSHREDALISSWQAMHRNRQINQASQITRRKRT
jgi:Na+-transporting methylmalonyl-CoA/oxaloacetate decarboxylase gamma subunit